MLNCSESLLGSVGADLCLLPLRVGSVGKEELCGGQPWLAIKAACLCLQDRLFQNYEGGKKSKKIKGLFWFREIVVLGAKRKSGN